MKRFCRVATFVAVTLVGSYTFAQGSAPSVEDVRAAEHDFNKGRDAYKIGDFTEAAEFFESADGHAPNPKVLELAMAARQKAGQLDRAAILAQLSRERYPDNEELAELAAPILEKAVAELLALTVECDEPCTLLDGTRLVHGEAVTKRKIFLSPGRHTIRASWSHDRTLSQEVSGDAGAEETISFSAPEIPEEPAEPVAPAPSPATPVDRGPAEQPTGMPPAVFFTGAGVTAAVAGVATWSAFDTQNNPGREKVKANCVGQGTACPEYQDGKNKELRTNILWGATGAVGAATILIGALFTNWSGGDSQSADEGDASSASITPFIGFGRGATVGATGRF